MTRTLLTVAVLAVVAVGALAAGGCQSGTSNEQPYSLKGNTGNANPSYNDQVDATRNKLHNVPGPSGANGE